MEASVRFMLNVFWKVHFSGWLSLPCFGKPWNPALLVSPVMSKSFRPRRVLMARAVGAHRAAPRREGCVWNHSDLLSECDPCLRMYSQLTWGISAAGIPVWEPFWQPHGPDSAQEKVPRGTEALAHPGPATLWEDALLGRMLVGSAWK